MNITITEKHIRRGKPNTTTSCAIALAARPELGPVYVSPDGITNALCNGANTWLHDEATREWVAQFDRGETVYPFSLILEDLK